MRWLEGAETLTDQIYLCSVLIAGIFLAIPLGFFIKKICIVCALLMCTICADSKTVQYSSAY